MPLVNKNLPLHFQRTFDTPDGKIVLEQLSKLCRENKPCIAKNFVTGAPNAEYTMYNEGKRCVILHIRRMLEKSIYHEKQTKAL